MEYKNFATRDSSTEEKYNWIDKIILVAEDIEINFLYIRELLEPTGAIIIHAENGKEALEYCQNNNNVSLILMDLLMPVMNGYDATRKIKGIRGNIPIIAQTAYY